jgi:hypothetical protein
VTAVKAHCTICLVSLGLTVMERERVAKKKCLMETPYQMSVSGFIVTFGNLTVNWFLVVLLPALQQINIINNIIPLS